MSNSRPIEHIRKTKGKVIPINVGVKRRQERWEESIARSKALHPANQPAPGRRILTDLSEIEDMMAELEEEEKDLDFVFGEYEQPEQEAQIIEFPKNRKHRHH